MKKINMSMSVNEFLIIINEALKVLEGQKVNRTNYLMKLVNGVVEPLMPKELHYENGVITSLKGYGSDGKYNLFKLERDINQDKRVTFGVVGKIINVWYTKNPNIKGETLSELVFNQQKMMKKDTITRIEELIAEKELELAKLRKDLAEELATVFE